MSDSFDASAYSTVPTVNAAATLALTRRLIAEMPTELLGEARITAAAERMRDRATLLRGERLKALNPSTSTDTRPFDQGEDVAWRALYDRLNSYTKLSDTPEGQRAAMVEGQLFGAGLGFLNLPYKEQWEESNRLLTLIDSPPAPMQPLQPALDELCGPLFLQAVRDAHAEYGEALGMTSAKPAAPAAPAIAEGLQGLRAAVRLYARRIVALADEEEPDSLSPVTRALAPIAELQAEVRRRRASGEPDPEPKDEGAIPPLPSA